MSNHTVAFFGFGKRAINVYVPLLKKLEKYFSVTGFYRRNNDAAEKNAKEFGIEYFRTPDSLVLASPDIIIVSVPVDAQLSALHALKGFSGTILLDTPIVDINVVNASRECSSPVGVMEQWPFLPLEQFKKKLYDLSIIERPFLVQNDCRSYDYHAIAQLRSYLGSNTIPVSAYAMSTGALLPPHNNMEGIPIQERLLNDIFDIGIVKMRSGAVINHTFSYPCKISPTRGLQTLRGYSRNGSIITGRRLDKSNDYEIIDIRFLMGNETISLSPKITRSNNSIISIDAEEFRVKWTNPFPEYNLRDQDIAIASVILAAAAGNTYSVTDSYIDNLVIQGIKYSSHKNQLVNFGIE
tara:strand:- start:3160 stop:4218 length:1059 start_codon:yes stop_codon:yes gene_type:complete